MNDAGIKKMIIAIIVISGILIGVSDFNGSIATNYATENVTSTAYMNRSIEINQEMSSMRDSLDIPPILDVEFVRFVVGSLSALRKSFGFLDIGQDLINDLLGESFIPDWFINILYGVFGMMMISGFVYVVMKIKL